MTIVATEAENLFTGTGVTTVFPTNIFAYTASSMFVYLRQDGIDTLQTLNTHYTLNNLTAGAEVTVTMNVAPASGQQLLVQRITPRVQETDITASNAFLADVLERQYDLIVMMAQETKRQADRSFGIAPGLAGIGPLNLTPAERASRTLAFGVDGTTLVPGPTPADLAAAQAAATLAQESATIAVTAVTAVTPEAFGAIGNYDPGTDTGTDDTAAIKAMLAWVAANEAGSMVFKNRYLVTEPLVVNGFGVKFVSGGSGSRGRIYARHTVGPVIHLRKSNSAVLDVDVIATPARAAGSYGPLNCGVMTGDVDWTNPGVGYGQSGAFIQIKDNVISGHPGPGILQLAGGGSEIQRNSVTGNGAGIIVDTGQLFGLTSAQIGFNGWSDISRNRVNSNKGPGIQIGDPGMAGGNIIYRYSVHNNDVGANQGLVTHGAYASAPGQIVLIGEQITSLQNVVSSSGPDSYPPGIFAAGTQQHHIDNRFVAPVGAVYTIGSFAGFPTAGVVVDEFRVNGAPSALNPAVELDDAITADRGVRVYQGSVANITNLLSTGDQVRVAEYRFQDVQRINGTVRLGDMALTPYTDFTAFTPTITCSPAGDFSVVPDGSHEGWYRRVGKFAYVRLRLVFTPTFTSGGTMLVGGLPFSLANTKLAKDNLPVSQFEKIKTGTMTQLTIQRNNATTLRIVGSGPNAVAVILDAVTHLTSGVQSVILAEGWLEVV